MNSDSDDSILSFHGAGVTCAFAKLPYRRPFLPPENTPLPKSVPNTPKNQKTSESSEKITKKSSVFYPNLNQVIEKESTNASPVAEELDIADFEEFELDVQSGELIICLKMSYFQKYFCYHHFFIRSS